MGTALNADLFPTEVAFVSGLIEASIGIGYLLGPVLGGFLYQTWGFAVTFWVAAAVVFLNFCLCVIYLAAPLLAAPPSNTNKILENDESPHPTARLLNSSTTAVCICIVSTGSNYGVLDPLLAPHLTEAFGFSSGDIGLFFAFPAFCYALLAPAVGHFLDEIKPNIRARTLRRFIAAGMVINGLAFTLAGPAPLLGLPPVFSKWGYMLGSFFLMVIGMALGQMPALPHMLKSLPDTHNYRGKVSAIFNSTYSLGMAVSPS
jgi:MFS family permease